jgi:hypothetical protein
MPMKAQFRLNFPPIRMQHLAKPRKLPRLELTYQGYLALR